MLISRKSTINRKKGERTVVSYTIPEKTLDQLRKQAAASQLPFSTMVKQRLYDLEGLAEVLSSELALAQEQLNQQPAGKEGQTETSRKVAELTRKLQECQAQIAAYQKLI